MLGWHPKNALQRLHSSINIVEVVTDASTSIKKMIGKIQFICDVKCSRCLQLICQIHARSTIYGTCQLESG